MNRAIWIAHCNGRVGNHSGGNLTPDTIVFTLAFYGYFGVERG